MGKAHTLSLKMDKCIWIEKRTVKNVQKILDFNAFINNAINKVVKKEGLLLFLSYLNLITTKFLTLPGMSIRGCFQLLQQHSLYQSLNKINYFFKIGKNLSE